MASQPTTEPQQPQGDATADRTTAENTSQSTIDPSSLSPHHFPFGYQNCTIDELRQFLNDRQHVTEECEPKGLLVERLLQADRDWQFRFLDLPTELRVYVYRHLLHFYTKPAQILPGPVVAQNNPPTLAPPSLPQPVSAANWDQLLSRTTKTLGWPNICRVSPQIRKEAEDVLYGENDFEINISQQPNHRGVWVTAVHKYSSSNHLRSLADAPPKTLPKHLLKMQIVSINIKFVDSFGTNNQPIHIFRNLHYHLYYVCSFLADSTSLKKVTINVDATDYPGFSQTSERLLWPLVKLPTTEVTTVRGVPADVLERLLQERHQHRSGSSLHRTQKICQHALELQNAFAKLDGSHELLGSYKREVANAAATLRNAPSTDSYADHVTDAWLERCAEKFEARIMSIPVDEVKSHLRRQVQLIERCIQAL